MKILVKHRVVPVKLSIASALSLITRLVASGKIIAEALLAAGHEVCLITTPSAIKPEPHPNLSIREVKHNDLRDESSKLPVNLIHSMACNLDLHTCLYDRSLRRSRLALI